MVPRAQGSMDDGTGSASSIRRSGIKSILPSCDATDHATTFFIFNMTISTAIGVSIVANHRFVIALETLDQMCSKPSSTQSVQYTSSLNRSDPVIIDDDDEACIVLVNSSNNNNKLVGTIRIIVIYYDGKSCDEIIMLL